ncbi:hypothetical protein PtA15_5A767 [Puccinia triticina]|uniref:BAR domain-containing protein n=1 Tax=Puccinia triticina TaxID=208348 RepID=A0ABY7CIZ7_9BASI|nr:uncharacterized protein PtA15_5A767 [Puccinia triticina]WAQ85193.1 hypothetical protein PtA15_5A767 [Puccinia triticina]
MSQATVKLVEKMLVLGEELDSIIEVGGHLRREFRTVYFKAINFMYKHELIAVENLQSLFDKNNLEYAASQMKSLHDWYHNPYGRNNEKFWYPTVTEGGYNRWYMSDFTNLFREPDNYYKERTTALETIQPDIQEALKIFKLSKKNLTKQVMDVDQDLIKDLKLLNFSKQLITEVDKFRTYISQNHHLFPDGDLAASTIKVKSHARTNLFELDQFSKHVDRMVDEHAKTVSAILQVETIDDYFFQHHMEETIESFRELRSYKKIARRSGQCRTAHDKAEGGFKNKSAVQDETKKPTSSLQSHYHQTNQESQNLKEYSSPVFTAVELHSVEDESNTSQSPKDTSKQSSNGHSVISPPNASTSLYDSKPQVADIPPTPSSGDHIKPDFDDGKEQSTIVIRDILIAISILALSLLFLGIMWLALIVFRPMIRSSRMRFDPRYRFKRNKKTDDPPQWWTQFHINSQRSEGGVWSDTRNLAERSNPAGSTFGPTNGMITESKPWHVSEVVPTEFPETYEVLNDPESQWEPENTRIHEKHVPQSRLETWLRGNDEMRGRLFSATVVWHKDPSLFSKKEPTLVPGLPSLGPSDSASRF